MNEGNVSFRFVNNENGGTADHIDVRHGTTVGEFLRGSLKGDLSDYTIRYTPRGGSPVLCREEQVIENGSRVTATKNKIQGA